jgi:exodeoxyribonuclease-1
MSAPAAVLRGVDLDRIGLDPERCQRHADLLAARMGELRTKVMDVFTPLHGDPGSDPDTMIYSGGFFSDRDRANMNRIRVSKPDQLGEQDWQFEDARLTVMLFRYRARNFPETLEAQDWAAWEADRAKRLAEPADDRALGFDSFERELAAARAACHEEGAKLTLLDTLEDWVKSLHIEPTAESSDEVASETGSLF